MNWLIFCSITSLHSFIKHYEEDQVKHYEEDSVCLHKEL